MPFDAPAAWMFALIGGAMIGLAAAMLLALNGRILGVSGIVGGLLKPKPVGAPWRSAFLAGMLVVGLAARFVAPELLETTSPSSLPWLVFGGLLVGAGTAIGGGCTSGHGVCGIGRMSPRSLAATAVFMAAGMATVILMRVGVWS